MYSRNIFTPLGLKSETSAHAQLVITLLYILLRNILALTLRIPMINVVTRCRRECGHMTLPGTYYNLRNFLVEMPPSKVDFWMQQIWQKASAKFTD